MLFKDFDYHGTQILEGIDKIKVMLQPAIYHLLDEGKGKQIDSRTGISLVHSSAQFPADDPDILFYTKPYIYLNIQGECIDHTRNMKQNISSALMLLIRKDVLKLDFGPSLRNDAIYDNLHLFIRGINEVEFFADFRPECIRIAENTEIIETSDRPAFNRFKKLPINDRAGTLIHYKDTYYSYDYKDNRDSTIIFYNRAERLLEQGNVYPKKVIEANPYKMRIEFRLKKNNSYKVLAIENLNGNYLDIFNSYMGLLTVRFRKYFYGLVLVDSTEHPLFNLIYKGAEQDGKIRNTKSALRSSLDEKVLYREAPDGNRRFHLSWLLKKEQNRKGVIKDIPDRVFFDLKKPDSTHFRTPFDYEDKSKILYEDADLTVFKDDFRGKDGSYISIPEQNEGTDTTTNSDSDGFSDEYMTKGKVWTPFNKDTGNEDADFMLPNFKNK
jgi:hypothetical protein